MDITKTIAVNHAGYNSPVPDIIGVDLHGCRAIITITDLKDDTATGIMIHISVQGPLDKSTSLAANTTNRIIAWLDDHASSIQDTAKYLHLKQPNHNA